MNRFAKLFSILIACSLYSTFAAAAISDVQVGGTVDMYYMYNLNKPAQGAVRRNSPLPPFPNNINDYDPDLTGVGNPTGTTNHRMYDRYHNQITLALAEIELKKSSGEVGFLADFDFGDVAALNASRGALADAVYQNVGQAYITYSPSTVRGLHTKVGKSQSYMGHETYKAKDNWNYSRSFAFTYGLPVWLMGFDVGYDFMPDKFTATLHYANGWDNMYKREAAPTWGLSFAFPNLVEKLDVTINTIFGRSRPRMATSDPTHDLQNTIDANGTTKSIAERKVVDFEGNYKYRSDLSLGGNFIYGSQGRPNNQSAAVWWGMAAYAKMNAYAKATVSPRLEFYEDRDNITINTYTGSSSIWSATVTHDYELATNLDFKSELRYDMANQNMFNTSGVEGNGSLFTSKHKSATTITLAMVYTF